MYHKVRINGCDSTIFHSKYTSRLIATPSLLVLLDQLHSQSTKTLVPTKQVNFKFLHLQTPNPSHQLPPIKRPIRKIQIHHQKTVAITNDMYRKKNTLAFSILIYSLVTNLHLDLFDKVKKMKLSLFHKMHGNIGQSKFKQAQNNILSPSSKECISGLPRSQTI